MWSSVNLGHVTRECANLGSSGISTDSYPNSSGAQKSLIGAAPQSELEIDYQLRPIAEHRLVPSDLKTASLGPAVTKKKTVRANPADRAVVL